MVELISATALSLIKGIIKPIDEVKKTIDSFNAEYDKLKTNLEDLTPRIESVNQFDEEIADLRMNDGLTVQRRTEMNNLVKQLKDCQELIEKCAHLSFWNCLKFKFYTEKLKVCNESLKDFVTRRMVADIWEVILTNERVKYECSVPEPPKFTVGWTEPVGELKQKLLLEELPVIGICGPGGCGKSTLAEKLCEQVKGKFERISYISIPKLPDSPTEKKEEETLNWIAMFNKIWDDLIGGPRPPDFESARGALVQLKQHLKKRKTKVECLIVLDGVWSDSMLKKFVIGTPGLKTLVTSRVQLKDLDWSYSVRELTMKDAKDLFLHHALMGRLTSEHDEELVEQIVEGCKFHPLALKLIGASLNNADFNKWRITARKLHQRGGIFNNLKEIFWPLKTSLDSLKETVQRECFMDVGSFPDNKRIRAAALMDMWVHTRGQDEDGAYNILKELAGRHLIELFKRTRNETTDLDESFSDLFVAQQALLSELAFYVSKEEKSNTRLIINQGDTFPDTVKGKDMLSQAQIVFIQTGESVNFDPIDVPFPRAEVLILNFSSSSYRLPPFLNRMENVKVLIIANHNMTAAELSGLPPPGSLRSLKAVRLEKISLPIHCTLSEPYKGVQKLSIILCKVKEVLENFSEFNIQTMFPDLTELEIDYCDGLERLPTAVCGIVNLQKLSITNCHDLSELPEEIGHLSNLEVLRLSGCTSLERLPDSLSKPKKLRFLDLFGCSRIEFLPNDLLDSLEKIDLRRCSAKLPDSVINLEGLRDVICDEKPMWLSVKTKCRRLRVHGFKDFVSLSFLT